MSSFGKPPEDLDYSLPVEPMCLNVIGEQQSALKNLLTELIDTHPTKLTTDQRHDLRDVYRQILLNVICNSIRRIYSAIPRGTQAFEKSTYWSRFGLTFKFTVAALDRLHEEGFIVQMKGVYNGPGGFSRLTRIFGTDKLAQRVDAEKIAEAVDFGWDEDAAQVVLTDFPYKADTLSEDHPDLSRVTKINRFLKDHKWPQRGPIRVMYKKNPVYSGRVYSRFQNMPKELRAQMRIDGKETVELDYKSNHLMMLIAMLGQPLPDDPYLAIASKSASSRDQVKTFITASLGADSEVKAFNSLKRKRFNKELFNKIKVATTSLYEGLPLFKGVGVMLQSLEGQIALDIMDAGANEGIVVLPVHDSYITTVDNEDWLWDQMTNQWANNVTDGAKTRVEKKN
jgi:REP element-mobilizing transposase RayT